MEKVNEIKMGNKTTEQKKVVNNLEILFNSREEFINFFRDFA